MRWLNEGWEGDDFVLIRWHRRLDFRRLPGPVFDPPLRETAGRVTRWSCLWRNWKIDNLGVSDVTGSETGLQFSYLFGSKLNQALPCPPKWLSIHCEKYSSVHFWTRRHVVNFLWSSNVGFRLLWVRTDWFSEADQIKWKSFLFTRQNFQRIECSSVKYKSGRLHL